MSTERIALYRFFDESGRLLYVGVSLNVIVRLYQHRQQKVEWFGEIASCTVKYFDTRDAALMAERVAVQVEEPIHNIVHKLTGKRQASGEILLGPQRGASNAAKLASKYLKKNPCAAAWYVAERFEIALTTVYRLDAWKNRAKATQA